MKRIIIACITLALFYNYASAQHYIIFFAYPRGTVIDGEESQAGHAFVSFITKDNEKQQTILDAKWGFHPTDKSLMALWRDEGTILTERDIFSDKNIDFIVEVKDDKVYENCLNLKKDWIDKKYGIVAGKTCVTYARDVAKMIPNLLIPNPLLYQAPKPFLSHLRQANLKIDTESRKALSESSSTGRDTAPTRKPCSSYPGIVDDFLPDKPNFHYYFVESEVCTTDEFKNATSASIFAFLLKRNSYVAPTFDKKPIISCGKVAANIAAVSPTGIFAVPENMIKDDPIVTVIDNANLSVTNYTLENHRLHAGKVIREIIQRGKHIIIRTRGTGNNKNKIYAFINGSRLSMEYLWERVDATFIKDARAAMLATNSQKSNSGFKNLYTFTWRDCCCDNKGIFDANNYSLSQLKNTYQLCNFGANLTLSYQNIIEYPGAPNYSKVSLEKLEAEYNQKLNWFKTAQFVPGLYWQQLRDRRIRAIQQDYEAKKIGVLANSNPDILKNNRFADFCNKYVEALTSKDQDILISTWRQIVNEQKKQNADPDALERDFQKQYNSPDRLQWARYTVTIFGWSNCTVGLIDYVKEDGETEKQFNKLFIKTTQSGCSY